MSVTVAQLVQEGRYVAVPLDMCLDALYSEAGEPHFDIAMIQKILSTIVEDPTSPRFRNLNATKLLPRLTSPSLAGWYILRHAGFLKRSDRLLIPDEHYSPDTVSTVLAAVNTAADTAASRRAHLAEVQRRDDAEYAEQRAKREAAQKAKEAERERQAKEAVQKLVEARAAADAAAAAAAAAAAEEEATKARARAAAAALTPAAAGDGVPGAEMADGDAVAAGAAGAKTGSSASVFDSLSAEDMDKMTPEQLEELRKQAQEEDDAEMARRLNEELNGVPAGTGAGAGAGAGAGVGMADDDEDVDPALAAIAAAARKRAAAGAGVGAGAAALGAEAGGRSEERSTLGMTHEEKMEWLKNKMERIRERRAKEAIETEKAREMSRRDVGKAAQEVQEKLEMMRMKDAAALKRKEDNEKRAAMARMKAKVQEEKERRKIQAEQRAKELERIRAAKNAQ